MSSETVARRYATALADVVTKTGETENVRSELRSWQDLIGSNTDLQNALANPSIAHSSKEKVLESLVERARPSRTTSNFLRVLLRNDRLVDLPEINERFESELEERSGVVTAQVTSARELLDGEKAQLQSNLAELAGRTVKLEYGIDKDLIGGVVTRVGSTVYDASVKTQLENLREELIG
jgi:F-type H+-transporting ATPase subunit delta